MGKSDRVLGFVGIAVGAAGVGVWLVATVLGFDDPGGRGDSKSWAVFGLMVVSLVGVILVMIRHHVAHPGGAGSRWIGWGATGAFLCLGLMALAAEPVYTDGDWGRYITKDFPLALPVLLAGVSLAAGAVGLLRDLRAPAEEEISRPLESTVGGRRGEAQPGRGEAPPRP